MPNLFFSVGPGVQVVSVNCWWWTGFPWVVRSKLTGVRVVSVTIGGGPVFHGW